VWVFDIHELGADTLGGTPLSILTLFTDTPRSLTVSPDGKTVYAAGFNTGNQTTIIDEGAVCDGGENVEPCEYSDGSIGYGLPSPNVDIEGNPQPEEGLIVKFNGENWVDELDRIWDQKVMFSLPDKDVFKIDAEANPPAVIGSFQHVGTTLYNMIVNPVSGKVYVSNTDAMNEVRFEGTRPIGNEISSVIGHLHESRITVLSDGPESPYDVKPLHINKHIDYSIVPSPSGTKKKSLALLQSMAITRNGKLLYVAAKGSSKVGIFNTKELENDSFVPSEKDHIVVSGGGPTGIALSNDEKTLFVLTRFNNSIVVIDTKKRKEVESYSMYSPEPESVVVGRPYLYDANYTSSNGEAACASCHVEGDVDHLAWDLGNPLNLPRANLNRGHEDAFPLRDYHALKGPMTTQSIRGLEKHGPLHWRGSRTAAEKGGDSNDVDGAFKTFNHAFVGLMGRENTLKDYEMQALADFSLQLYYPPNPLKALDNSLTEKQQAGRDAYMTFNVVQVNNRTCNDCHRLDPENGIFGTTSEISNAGQTQQFKIPHFRNMYTRVGMFGRAITNHIIPGDGIFMGDQIRGYGYLHSGTVDTVSRTLVPIMPLEMGKNLVDFILNYDTNLAPIVGQQLTLSHQNFASASVRLDLMIERAAVGECDLIVKGNIRNQPRGWYLQESGAFVSDKGRDATLTDAELRKLVNKYKTTTLTYTCTPPGSGIRMGIDRNSDGVYDSDWDIRRVQRFIEKLLSFFV